jgi:Ca2+-binding EF-hand superfamily protein
MSVKEERIMKKAILTALSVLLATFSPAVAQSAPAAAPLTQGHFDHLDKDKNGKISKAEYQAYMGQAFDKLDTNRNASLSRDEAGKILTVEQVAVVDGNKDGGISRAEFLNHVTLEFDQNDRNRDGHLQ